jgi:hypothetical protein
MRINVVYLFQARKQSLRLELRLRKGRQGKHDDKRELFLFETLLEEGCQRCSLLFRVIVRL